MGNSNSKLGQSRSRRKPRNRGPFGTCREKETQQILLMRDVVVGDPVALQKWPIIVGYIVQAPADILRIQTLLTQHQPQYELAVLNSLTIWYGYGQARADLLNVLRNQGLHSLAEELCVHVTSLAFVSSTTCTSLIKFDVGEVVDNLLDSLHKMLVHADRIQSIILNMARLALVLFIAILVLFVIFSSQVTFIGKVAVADQETDPDADSVRKITHPSSHTNGTAISIWSDEPHRVEDTSPEIWRSWGSRFANRVTEMACKLPGVECCRAPSLRRSEAASILRRRLKSEFFGQHLAQETVVIALGAHLKDTNPGKALVMSLHGCTGSGKTYLAMLLIESLFERGLSSSYYKFYQASLHFPDKSRVVEYQEKLRSDIKLVLRSCAYGVFVFDEVDKTPPGVFDAIVPFINYPGHIEGVPDHKRSIFIFLSNTGSNEIAKITMAGKRREELRFRDYEEWLEREAFTTTESGLLRSALIDRALVDYFIPFLPMERKHVLQCIEMEMKRHGKSGDEGAYSEIADTLSYWPADTKRYSVSGCKKIESAVKHRIQKELHIREGVSGAGDADDDEKEQMEL